MNEGSAREAHLRGLWHASMVASSRLLPLSLSIVAFAITAVSSVVVVLSVPTDPAPFALTALFIAAVSTGFALWRLGRARAGISSFQNLVARLAEVPPDPPATAAMPAGLLQPDDATSVAQLDRILRRDKADWATPHEAQIEAVRASTVAALALMLASLALIVGAVGFLLALFGILPNDHVLVPRICLLVAALGPLFVTGSVLSSGAEFSRIEYAREWLRAQELLDARHLPYDGEPLTVIAERSGNFVADPALVPKATRPLPAHFDMVRRGHRVDPLRRGLGWALVPASAAALAAVLALFGG